MDRRTIGRLVNYERNKRKISAQELTQGICSLSALQRLESGERLPDFFVLERIIERLGKSVNKIEFLYNEQAFQLLKLMRKERQMKRLQSRYREWYGEEIE